MQRPHCVLHRVLLTGLTLALLCAGGVKAATTDDDDADKKAKAAKSGDKSDDDTPKKKSHKDTAKTDKTDKDAKTAATGDEKDKNAKKTAKTADKSDDDTPKKRSHKDTAKTDKTDKDVKTAATGDEKDKNSKKTAKTADKSDDDTPKKKSHKDTAKTDKTDKDAKTATTGDEKDKNSKKTAKTSEKTGDESADKKSHKDAEKSETVDKTDQDSGKMAAGTEKLETDKAPEESKATKPVSKKAEDAPPKDVTDQKADRPRDEKAMREGDGEFDNTDKSRDTATSAKKDEGKHDDKKGQDKSANGAHEMQGWEVVHYQDRDYVTSNSIQRFYRFVDHKIDGSEVWFTSPVLVMKAVIGSQDLLINNIKFILSNPVEEVNGKILFSRLDLCKLIDPVLRPSFIGHSGTFDTVIVDAGHGGYDSGARGLYGYEKNFTLQLAELLKADLENRGFKVTMTRTDDTFISLGGRVEFANKVPNSIFVSLHFNSGQSSATGIETYALSPQGSSSDYGARSVDALSFNGNQRDSENIALATAIHASVVHHFRLVDRGVKRARWYVLTGLERPGVLFEGGFVTNGNDGQLIAAENFRKELAHTIGDAIANYRRALQPGSTGRHGE